MKDINELGERFKVYCNTYKYCELDDKKLSIVFYNKFCPWTYSYDIVETKNLEVDTKVNDEITEFVLPVTHTYAHGGYATKEDLYKHNKDIQINPDTDIIENTQNKFLQKILPWAHSYILEEKIYKLKQPKTKRLCVYKLRNFKIYQRE